MAGKVFPQNELVDEAGEADVEFGIDHAEEADGTDIATGSVKAEGYLQAGSCSTGIAKKT